MSIMVYNFGPSCITKWETYHTFESNFLLISIHFLEIYLVSMLLFLDMKLLTYFKKLYCEVSIRNPFNFLINIISANSNCQWQPNTIQYSLRRRCLVFCNKKVFKYQKISLLQGGWRTQTYIKRARGLLIYSTTTKLPRRD